MNAGMLLSANDWFIGLLFVMIVITVLFGFILWIALKPIKKDDLGHTSSARRALARRETELTVALLKLMEKEQDQAKRAELESKLREVKAAEKLVAELLGEEENEAASAEKSAKPSATAPQAPAKPAAKPARPAPATAPVKPVVMPQPKASVKPAAEPQPKEAPNEPAKPAEKPE